MTFFSSEKNDKLNVLKFKKKTQKTQTGANTQSKQSLFLNDSQKMSKNASVLLVKHPANMYVYTCLKKSTRNIRILTTWLFMFHANINPQKSTYHEKRDKSTVELVFENLHKLDFSRSLI